MKTEAKIVRYDTNGKVELSPINIESLLVLEPCIISIDGSTDVTGVAILRESDGAIVSSIAFRHEKQKESPIQYKVRLKREFYTLLKNNPVIKEIFYEEPFIGYTNAVKNLFMLRTFVEEIKFENEPELDYILFTEINNQKWKKLFLAPDKCPSGTELQKSYVRNKLVSSLSFLSDVTQDEIDAIAMGFTAVSKLRDGEKEELKSKKKPKPFNYNIQFIGADNDDGMLQDLYSICNAPEEVMQSGMKLTEITGKGNWDDNVYEHMGLDDKLLILKFKSTKYGNIILKHNIGHLAETYDYIYAIIWRKNRKKY